MYVRLPPGFTDVHKEITHRFVQGESFSQVERALLFEAFDLLHRAGVATEAGWASFVTAYEQLIEAPFANHYLRGLVEAQDIEATAEPLPCHSGGTCRSSTRRISAPAERHDPDCP